MLCRLLGYRVGITVTTAMLEIELELVNYGIIICLITWVIFRKINQIKLNVKFK